jgi:hypothetical protein
VHVFWLLSNVSPQRKWNQGNGPFSLEVRLVND